MYTLPSVRSGEFGKVATDEPAGIGVSFTTG